MCACDSDHMTLDWHFVLVFSPFALSLFHWTMGCAEQTLLFYKFCENWEMPSSSIFIFFLLMYGRQCCFTIFFHYYFVHLPIYTPSTNTSSICVIIDGGCDGWYSKAYFSIYFISEFFSNFYFLFSFIFSAKNKIHRSFQRFSDLHVGASEDCDCALPVGWWCVYARTRLSADLCEQFARQVNPAQRYQCKLHSKIKRSRMEQVQLAARRMGLCMFLNMNLM